MRSRTSIKQLDTNRVRPSRSEQTALSEPPMTIWLRSRPLVLYEADAGHNQGRGSYEVAQRAYLRVPPAQRTKTAPQERKMS
jgi:hypothetical protein